VLECARKILGRSHSGVPIAAGANTDYIFTTSSAPPAHLIDAFAFALNPQVHAFDDASLVETLEAQTAIVRDAAGRSGKPVVVSPVTFRPRWNPYATGAAQQIQPDPRQGSLFAAAWTIGSLRALAIGGAASVTYFETIGPCGLMDGEGVFPVFLALRDALEFGGDVLEWRSSDPSRAQVLVLESNGHLRVIAIHLTAEPVTVRIRWPHRRASIRTLDETNALEAMRMAHTETAEEIAVHDGTLEIVLAPFALMTIDQIAEERQ
jgi:D-apionolactonase